MKWIYNDGGRKLAGYKGETGDCVVRSIAIISNLPYQELYDHFFEMNKQYAIQRRGRVAKALKKNSSPRNGIYKEIFKPFLEKELKMIWTPTMTIGSGCKVHLKKEELPSGKLIVSVSKHITAVIDGVIHDLSDCSRNETRCVYGYWK